jgi:hypothetical protein
VHQQPLDGGAALARVFVGALHRQRGGFVEVGIFHHDDGVVAAQLQHHAAVAGLGGDVFADRHTAGKGHQVDQRVGDQFVGDLARVAGHHAEHLRRQARLVKDVGEQDGRERHLLGRLEHHAVVGRDAGHDLVRHLVHRVVEGRDGGDHAQQRRAVRIDAALFAVRREVAAEDLAVVLEHLGGAEQQHVADAAGFVDRVLQAQARFGGDQAATSSRRSRMMAARGSGWRRVRSGSASVCRRALWRKFAHLLQRGLGHRADAAFRCRD